MTTAVPTSGDEPQDWTLDTVTTRTGVAIPVRATARRPSWNDLPADVRRRIAHAAGSQVVEAWSAGSGFTPGFASRLTLADGRRMFVKAASSAFDRLHGWELSRAYREEIRKLTLLPAGIAAPALLWSIDEPIGDETWVGLGLEYVDGRPPRRPWDRDELRLVTDLLTEIAPRMAVVPEGLHLGTFEDDFGGWAAWLAYVEQRDGPSGWLDEVAELAGESVERCSSSGMAHLDLRDDNILIDRLGGVWICDWNFPMLAAPFVDLVSVLLSARGDGLDVDAVLDEHPLTCHLEARSVDALLANLWLYFECRQDDPVPPFSPHLRDHQRWYGEVTGEWLRDRLAARGRRFPASPGTPGRTGAPGSARRDRPGASHHVVAES